MVRKQRLLQAVEILKKGGVVVVPTETVYGLAASIESQSGVEKIFSIKKRPFFDPLIVHISRQEQVHQLTDSWSEICQVLVDKFWPGPLTLVLPKTKKVSDLITAGLQTVGLRMPHHPVILELIDVLQVPIAAPSANIFKKTSPTKAEHVLEEFEEEDLFVLDGGACQVGIESTVIAVEGNQLSILRPGAVTEKQLLEVLERSKLPFFLNKLGKNLSASPGHMKEHYMPTKPLILWTRSWQKGSMDEILDKAQEIAIDVKKIKGSELKLLSDPVLAARTLYSQMRELSQQSEVTFIYCIWSQKKDQDLWAAIWNRLDKASSYCF